MRLDIHALSAVLAALNHRKLHCVTATRHEGECQVPIIVRREADDGEIWLRRCRANDAGVRGEFRGARKVRTNGVSGEETADNGARRGPCPVLAGRPAPVTVTCLPAQKKDSGRLHAWLAFPLIEAGRQLPQLLIACSAGRNGSIVCPAATRGCFANPQPYLPVISPIGRTAPHWRLRL